MIYSLEGVLKRKQDTWAVIEVSGIGYKVTLPLFVMSKLPSVGEKVSILTHHHIREDASDLYGFMSDDELSLFESLISVSGIGPKSAMGIMGVAPIGELVAAINEGRVDLLSKASGVGKKTAERAILDLKGKLTFADTSGTIKKMEGDSELEETLVGLGYSKAQAKTAISKIDPAIVSFQDKLRAVLREYKKGGTTNI
jgi:Holliday junction DNA helicase RuvA